ncbi:hypothetical protein KAI04_00740 [Candidatus Pacearchaeota archaeon]|nr:hypothetical protein [Candidatus Pacearchaeota archaeon]
MERKYGLDSLKQEYSEIQGKYNLPSFEELNEDFNIEKASEIEVELLIREIRRFMADKLSTYMRFVEAILNPTNVQMFIYSLIKSLENGEKDKLTEIYKKLSRNELKLIELDIKYSEEKEALFIKESYLMWQTMKEDLLGIIKKANDNWDNNKSESKNKDYFG